MPNDIMVDCETMGTRMGSVILSIGAVVFEPLGDATGLTFYTNIDRDLSRALGLTEDVATQDWWSKQSVEARAALNDPPPQMPQAAFRNFNDWVRRSLSKGGCVWSHGATFDIPLIGCVLDRLEVRPSWPYFAARDTRTLFALAGSTNDRNFVNQFRPEGDIAHNALRDAIAQARAVQHCMKKLRLWRTMSPELGSPQREDVPPASAGRPA